MIISFNKSINYKNKGIKKKYFNNKIIIENNTENHGYLVKPKLFKGKSQYIKIKYSGEVVEGNSAVLCVYDTHKILLGEITLNATAIIKLSENKKFLLSIKVMPHTNIKINDIFLDFIENYDEWINNYGKNDTLIITPSYPSWENKYFSGFVHSRLKAYKEAGIKFDVACSYFYNNITEYEFEGINVLKCSHFDLRKLLQNKKYKKILVHFFDEYYANIFDSVDLSDSQLYLWVHGPETLYKDCPKFLTTYFSEEYKINQNDLNRFAKTDEIIKRYSNKKNVTWIFVSNWIKKRSEELLNISFNNYQVIPNIINEKIFNYIPKNPEQRKKIYFLRRFDNIDKYAIDVNVRTILALSKRKIFNDLEFNIYGIGNYYNELVNPIKKFHNVHLYPKFLNHEEIAKIHKENGIALFATRYDAQGVSMCEAAMSGLVIVTSDNDAVKEFLPSNANIFAPTEEYEKYADIIENLYYNESEFEKLSKSCHDSVYKLCSKEKTIDKEIALIKQKNAENEIFKIKQEKNIILSIIIPAYNVSNYLLNTIHTIIDQKNAKYLEIIIVNDGSKDDTLSKANYTLDKYCDKNKPIIKIIDKKNGGHGSTINEGLKIAKGKYVRIIDGDDWVNSNDLCKLIEILKKEESDIVLTNYSEDLAYINLLSPKNIYNFMKSGNKYQFSDLCDEFYGFKEWGPILSTGNFKLKTLKKTNFELTEKCFYVDMEFNIYSILNATTVTYYNLNIYRYFIGRNNQSVSKESFIKNRKQHEKVLFNMIKIINSNEIEENKKNYIIRLLLFPMIKAHYTILIEYLKNRNEFLEFDKKMKKQDGTYYSLTTKTVKFHRKTKGIFIKENDILKRIYNKFFAK